MTQKITLLAFLLTLAFSLVGGGDLCARGNFVYTNDDVPGANTVSAFSAAANGVLTPIADSPFLTGGLGTGGGFFAANRVTVCVVGNFLYVGNDRSNDVSGFSINPITGALTLVPGSPFPSGTGLGNGLSLAATPDGQFLMAGNGSDIAVFDIAANGALTPIADSPFPAGGSPDGMQVSPDGTLLAVALPLTGGGAVAMFSVAADGSLSPVPGSPFPDGGPGFAAGVEFNCAGDLLFAGEANFGATIVDVFDVAASGALTPIAPSPFIFPVGSNSNVVFLSPDEQHLFVSNQASNTVTTLDVAADGGLSVVPGSPFPVGGGAFFTSGLATNPAGTLLYAANSPNLVGVFSIDADGSLFPAPASPFSTGQPTGLLSLAAFPPKTCEMQVPIDIKPGSCPNPLNPRSRGVLPVAIAGTETLDVTDIDPPSIRLASFVLSAGTTFQSGVSVPPLRSTVTDVATPFEPPAGREDCFEDCTDRGPDGWPDLSLKFDTQAVVEATEEALGRELEAGECLVVGLTGRKMDGTRIRGEDVMVVRGRRR